MDYTKRLERILEHTGGEWSLQDVLDLIHQKKLFLFHKGDYLILFDVQAFPQKRVLHIWGFEGDGALNALHELFSWSKEIARALDCTEVRCQGRKGWERALSKHGTKFLYSTLVLEL